MLSRCRYVKFNEDTLSKGGHGNVHGLKKGKKIGEKWSFLLVYHDKIQGFSAHQQLITVLFITNFFLISFFNFHVHSLWVVRHQYSKQHSKAQAAVSLIKRKKKHENCDVSFQFILTVFALDYDSRFFLSINYFPSLLGHLNFF